VKNSQGPHQVLSTNYIVNSIYRLPNGKLIVATDKEGLCEYVNRKLIKPRQASPSKNYYAFTYLNDSLFVAQSDSSLDVLNFRYELFSSTNEHGRFFVESGLYTDSKKRVWVGTTSGLRLLANLQEKGKPLRFSSLPGAFDLPMLRDQHVQDIIEDHAGNLWFGTATGLVKVGADGSHQVLKQQDGLPADDVSRIFQDREKNIWVGGSLGLAKLVTNTNIRIYTTENGLLSNSITMLLPLNDGNLLVGTPRGSQLYNKNTGSFMSGDGPRQYQAANSGSLSIKMHRGLDKPFIVFSSNPVQRASFSPSSSGPYFAFEDKQHGYFYPTHGGLLFSRDFVNWRRVLFSDPNIAIWITAGQELWIGSRDSGLYRFRYDYINDTPRAKEVKRFLPGIGIRSLYKDSKGCIWAGSRYHGIYRLNPNDNDTAILHFDQSTGLTSNRITSIAEDAAGCIWVDFYHGLDKLVPSGTGYRVFNFSRFNNLFTNIQALVFDENQSMWLATTQGLINIADGQTENLEPLQVFIMSAFLGDSVYNSHPGKTVTLGYRHKKVQFDFAAPGFINEKQTLFSYRLIGASYTEWSNPSNEHSVSYANLQPGKYRFEVRNQGWNGEWGNPTSFEFVIKPPFWLTWWFITAVAITTALLFYWMVKRRIKSIRKESALKQKISETEMMALRAQMNPHFIFNCLNAIDNLVQTNQKEKATTYLARFARLIRSILDSSKNNVVPFQNDYESLKLYLEMEQFRCNNKFSYQLTAEHELLHSDYKMPPLIVQPFVENAIHHGLLNKQSGDRRLVVSAVLEDDHILYTVIDNGVGRARAAAIKELNKPDHRSYGMAITRERVHLYNQNTKSKDIVITDLTENGDAAGTRVEIRLKIADHK
jgi:ligand-binding sensor domain-containing protein